jgi:hypothetical protein
MNRTIFMCTLYIRDFSLRLHQAHNLLQVKHEELATGAELKILQLQEALDLEVQVGTVVVSHTLVVILYHKVSFFTITTIVFPTGSSSRRSGEGLAGCQVASD